jgi:tetratricopeptide (TPR) repeat protein
LYEAAQVLSLMNKPDDAVATYKRALDEIKDQTKNLWGLTADINKSIAEIYRANANKLSGEAQTEARRNAIAHFKSAIEVVYTEFPKKWMRVSALAQNESRWIAAIERLIGGLKNSRQRGEWERVVQSEKNWQFELKKRRWLAERYTDLGNLYKEENQIHEARVAHTLAVERRYNLVARDEAEIKRRSYDNESARRLLADAMRDTAFLEKEDRLPNAVRLSAICVDVMADLAGRQDAKPANQQMIGHCYRLAGSSHASLVKRNSNDKSEETRHRMAALAAYRQSADFYQKAAQDKRYTQAAHNAILMQRNVASMLIALGELQKAVEAGEKAIRMSEEGYKERKNDEARDDLASSYGIGSWYALVSRTRQDVTQRTRCYWPKGIHASPTHITPR